MLYIALCGEYVRFEKFVFSGCCGGRESLSDTIVGGGLKKKKNRVWVKPTVQATHEIFFQMDRKRRILIVSFLGRI